MDALQVPGRIARIIGYSMWRTQEDVQRGKEARRSGLLFFSHGIPHEIYVPVYHRTRDMSAAKFLDS